MDHSDPENNVVSSEIFVKEIKSQKYGKWPKISLNDQMAKALWPVAKNNNMVTNEQIWPKVAYNSNPGA